MAVQFPYPIYAIVSIGGDQNIQYFVRYNCDLIENLFEEFSNYNR